MNPYCETVQPADTARTHLRGRPRGRLSPTGSTFCKRPESLIIMACHGFPQRLLCHLRSVFFKVEQIRSHVNNFSNNKWIVVITQNSLDSTALNELSGGAGRFEVQYLYLRYF